MIRLENRVTALGGTCRWRVASGDPTEVAGESRNHELGFSGAGASRVTQ